MTDRATELNIPVENVLTPELLRRLAWSPPEPAELDAVRDALTRMGARPWQVDAVAEPITAAFAVAAAPGPLAEPSDGFVESAQTIESTPDVES